jgi:hypothetical protein
MKNTAILFLIIVLLNSCTEGLHEAIVPIELNVNDIGIITVMDAKIEKDSSAWVQLSYSNDINNPYTAEPIYEPNATVQLSANNGIQETLVYTGSKGTYKGNSIKGSVGTNYSLTITIND